jgi:hypothetical protein
MPEWISMFVSAKAVSIHLLIIWFALFFLTKQCRLLNGRYVVKQLTNKLIRRHLFRTQTKEDRESLRVYVDHVRSNGGRLHFPAFHIWEYDFNKQLVECESLKISRQ